MSLQHAHIPHSSDCLSSLAQVFGEEKSHSVKLLLIFSRASFFLSNSQNNYMVFFRLQADFCKLYYLHFSSLKCFTQEQCSKTLGIEE